MHLITSEIKKLKALSLEQFIRYSTKYILTKIYQIFNNQVDVNFNPKSFNIISSLFNKYLYKSTITNTIICQNKCISRKFMATIPTKTSMHPICIIPTFLSEQIYKNIIASLLSASRDNLAIWTTSESDHKSMGLSTSYLHT